MKKIVLPGSFLAVEEEFMPGKNTEENNEGNIYSTVIGIPSYDQEKKIVKVKAIKQPLKIKTRDIIIGRVQTIKKNIALISIEAIKENNDLRTVPSIYAGLSIANIDTKFIESIEDVLGIGDIIKAIVLEVKKESINLSIKKPFLGVIKAYCKKCRKELKLIQGKLKCIECNRIQERKKSNEYGMI